LVQRKLTRVERLFIRSGESARAAGLYRRRVLNLVASIIANQSMNRREYVQVKLGLLEIYRAISSRKAGLEWLERAYLALEELEGLAREGAEPGVLLDMVREIKGEFNL